MRIRSIEQRDAARFAELNRRFNGSGARIEDRDETTEKVILAEIGEELVGFACIQINHSVCSESPWAELTELFVEKASRRRGVGAALVSEAERISWKGGCSELVLRTRANNLEARALFGDCGYDEAEHVVYRKRVPGVVDGTAI